MFYYALYINNIIFKNLKFKNKIFILTKMGEEFGSAFIMNFPNKTSPFWNMSQNEEKTHAKKIDVILGGMETIGSAERSTSTHEMRHMFEEISEGGYAKLLYELFGKKRVDDELDEFLRHEFVPRVGGGIGVTRMISALDKLEQSKMQALTDKVA